MASIAEELRSKIVGNAGIAAVVGARVYHANVPETAALPYIVYGRTAGVEEPQLDGSGGLVECDFTIECRAGSMDAADDLAELVRALIDRTSGTWGAKTIRGCFVKDTDDSYTPWPPGSDEGEYTVAYVAKVYYVP